MMRPESLNTRVRRSTVTALCCALIITAPASLAAQFPTTPPPPTNLGAWSMPPFVEQTLPNGLQVVLVENHELPIVSIRLSVPVGISHDPVGKEGLALITSEVLQRGTRTRSAEEIAQAIENVGASLAVGVGADFLSISTTVLNDHRDVAFHLIGDIVQQSTFPLAEVEIARTRLLSSLQVQESQPGFLAERFFSQAVYGDHPYGRSNSSASLTSITRDDLVTFWNNAGPNGALLIVAGDVTRGELLTLANNALGEWSGSNPQRPNITLPLTQPTSITLVNRPGSAQSNVIVGNLGLRATDPRFPQATVANRILGGGFDSRLFQILREQRGWTYGAYSNLARPQDIGVFQVNVEVRTEVTDSAVAEVLTQLRRMREETVDGEELKAAAGYLAGSFPLAVETPAQIATEVGHLRALGLPNDYLTTYRERISSVTTDQIRSISQDFIQPDSAVVVVVGNAAAVYEGLAQIAPVTVVNLSGAPIDLSDVNIVTEPLPIDPARLVARRDSFHVMVRGMPMGFQVSELTMTPDGMHFREVTQVPFVGLNQQVDVVFDENFSPRQIDKSMQAGPILGETHLTFENGRVMGTVVTPDRQTGATTSMTIDEAIVPGLLEPSAVQALLPALPLSVGARFSVMILETADGTLRPVTISVTSTMSLTVPAGTFETYVIDVTGTEEPARFYLTTADHRVVKIESAGQPITMELAVT